MIFNEILFELRRIANSLEAISNTKLERTPNEKPPPIEFFDSKREVDDEELIKESFTKSEIQGKLTQASTKGLFFEEDALSEEELMKL